MEDDYKGVVLTNFDIAHYQSIYGYDEQRILQYRDAFAVFDLDGDGVISINELGQVLVGLGYRPAAEEVEALVMAADKQKRGCIDFQSFLHILWKTLGVDHHQEMKEVFSLFDHNNDGFISGAELYDIMRRLGVATSKEEADEMIKEADMNNDGLVDFQEFNQILTSQGPHEYQSH